MKSFGGGRGRLLLRVEEKARVSARMLLQIAVTCRVGQVYPRCSRYTVSISYWMLLQEWARKSRRRSVRSSTQSTLTRLRVCHSIGLRKEIDRSSNIFHLDISDTAFTISIKLDIINADGDTSDPRRSNCFPEHAQHIYFESHEMACARKLCRRV